MTCDQWDVVIVPFPYTDLNLRKKRPAVVVSGPAYLHATGHVVVAMITSASRSSWPDDVLLTDTALPGVRRECLVRMKLATLDARIITGTLGALAAVDRTAVRSALESVFAGQL